MLIAVLVLLGCQAAGELFVAVTGIPVPGPVVGMVLLFFGLVVHGRIPDPLERLTHGLLSHLSLLFVPAGVGIIASFDVIGPALVPIAIAVTLGTLVTLVVTGRLAQALTREPRDPRS